MLCAGTLLPLPPPLPPTPLPLPGSTPWHLAPTAAHMPYPQQPPPTAQQQAVCPGVRPTTAAPWQTCQAPTASYTSSGTGGRAGSELGCMPVSRACNCHVLRKRFHLCLAPSTACNWQWMHGFLLPASTVVSFYSPPILTSACLYVCCLQEWYLQQLHVWPDLQCHHWLC